VKTKRMAAVICAFLLLSVGMYFWYRHKMLNQVIGYQPMWIMVDGVLYSHGGGAKQEKPEGPPDGTITEIIARHGYPQKDGQANFGSVGTPYWHYGGKIVVEGSRYYIFDEL